MVLTYPDAPAIRHAQGHMTYLQLDEHANRLAGLLLDRGAGRGDLVGLVSGRAPDAVIGMLGIMKAGAGYLPLDPDYPAEWQAAVLRDSRPCLLVGSRPTVDCEIPLLPSDDWMDEPAHGEPCKAVTGRPHPHDLMYVMYTSGSTGRPKGVKVSHGNVARLFPAVGAHLEFSRNDVWAHCHSPSFGFSVWEIWGALAHGGCLVIVPPETLREPGRTLEWLMQERVSVLSQTPTAFRMLARDLNRVPEAGLSHLRVVAFSGEPLDGHILQPWFARFGDDHPILVNLYALTETSGEITFHRVRASEPTANERVIGVPLPDVQLFLMDEHRRLVADGEIGELYVGGPAVALGYLGADEADEQRFLVNHIKEDGSRMYRTGDMARRLPDGTYQFTGRSDRQVKVRGYRIEPASVEGVLRTHDSVIDAVVLPDDQAGIVAGLAAFVVLHHRDAFPDRLRDHLSASVPHYAIPDRIFAIDRIPQTATGKLDTAALLAMRSQDSVSEESRELQNEVPFGTDAGNVAATIEQIWCQLLQRNTIARDEDFFDLGGHSLLTLNLVLMLEEKLGVDISMTDVFENPSLGQLSTFVSDRLKAARTPAQLPPPAKATLVNPARADGHVEHMRVAISKAREAIANGQPPYAACLVRNGRVLVAVHNVIWRDVDPTAHAEVTAIREACRLLGTMDLSDCVLYSTAEPCSMCLSATAWANIRTVVYSARMEDEERYGLSSATVPVATMVSLLGREIAIVPDCLRTEMQTLFEDWLRIKALAI